MTMPEVSVVMSVYNDEERVGATIESVLAQSRVDFELIIVNDGSSDGTDKTIAAYRINEPRIRVINQENQGITKALIAGCAAARGRYIARQDSGDLSLPDRLVIQRDQLLRNPNAVLSITGVREFLRDIHNLNELKPDADDAVLTTQLRERMVGIPAHGCVMFRRDAYFQAGGYRESFYYAQDCDLWLRMALLGEVVGTPEVLYALDSEIGGISTSRGKLQSEFARLASKAYRARQSGHSEEPFLSRAILLSVIARSKRSSRPGAYALAGAYFRLGTRVAHIDSAKARGLYLTALRTCPFYWRGWLKLL